MTPVFSFLINFTHLPRARSGALWHAWAGISAAATDANRNRPADLRGERADLEFRKPPSLITTGMARLSVTNVSLILRHGGLPEHDA